MSGIFRSKQINCRDETPRSESRRKHSWRICTSPGAPALPTQIGRIATKSQPSFGVTADGATVPGKAVRGDVIRVRLRAFQAPSNRECGLAAQAPESGNAA